MRGPVPEGRPALEREPDPHEFARSVVLRQLSMAPRTRAQLQEALERRQVPLEVAREVLDRFEEVDLVDDEAFAQAWVRSRHSGRGLARRALSHELRMRGVADEVVREAVGAVRPEDELERAKDLVRRRLRSAPGAGGSGVEQARQVRRLMGMLARRGYRTDQAGRAVREVLAEAGLDPDEI